VHDEAVEKYAPPLLDHAMFPEGEWPAIVAVQMVDEPTMTGDGEQSTFVVEDAFDADRKNVPTTCGLLASPP
jgi:hypothetical protein